LLASGLELYPMRTRVIFFTVPIFYIIIAEGADQIYKNLKNIHVIIGVLFIIILLYHPVRAGVNMILTPYHRQETRQLIDHLYEQRKQDEQLYVYYGAVPAFKYYSRNREWTYIEGTLSRGNPEQYAAEIKENLVNGKVWVLFSHSYEDEEKLITNYMYSLGDLIEVKETAGASLYLYVIDKLHDESAHTHDY
jgi:hypothetical protein